MCPPPPVLGGEAHSLAREGYFSIYSKINVSSKSSVTHCVFKAKCRALQFFVLTVLTNGGQAIYVEYRTGQDLARDEE